MRKMNLSAGSAKKEAVNLLCPKYGKKVEKAVLHLPKSIGYIGNKKSDFELLYEDSLSLEEKIEKIAKEIYGADGVVYEPAAKKTDCKDRIIGIRKFSGMYGKESVLFV